LIRSSFMSSLSTNLSPVSELVIGLDRNGGDALHRQIEASIRRRIRSGALPAGVSPYRLSPAPRGGLIFGYSNLSERAIADGIMRLARAVSSLREGTATAGSRLSRS
jgi:hypothetical protein